MFFSSLSTLMPYINFTRLDHLQKCYFSSPFHPPPTFQSEKKKFLSILQLEKVKLLINFSLVRKGKLFLHLLASISNGCRQQVDCLHKAISTSEFCCSIQLHSLCIIPLWAGLCKWPSSTKDYSEIYKQQSPDPPGHLGN